MEKENSKTPKTKKKNKKFLKLYNIYEEKREYPRIKIDILATVEKEDEYKAHVILHDISPDGVQLRCNRKNAMLIHPSGKFISDKAAPEATLKFSLDIEGKENEIIVRIKLFYFTVIDPDVIAFGAKFIQFENSCGHYVDDFIANSIIPIEEKVLSVLHSPRSSDDILDELEPHHEHEDLGNALNRLHKKKKIVAYEEDKTLKFVKIEAAISSIFERLENIEKRMDKLEQEFTFKD